MSESEHWQLANQRHLTASLAVLRQALTGRLESASKDGAPLASTSTSSPPQALATVDEPSPDLSSEAALQRVTRVFRLSPFERDILLLAAGPELSSSFAELISRTLNDPRRVRPTFSLALSLLPEAHWSAIAPMGPLRKWRLIDIGAADFVTECPLRVDEPVLHYLAGLVYADERTTSVLRRLPLPTAPLSAAHRPLADTAARYLADPSGCPLLRLYGPHLEGQRAIAVDASATVGLSVSAIKAQDIPVGLAEREQLARLWEREAWITGAVILIEAWELSEADRSRVSAFVDILRAPAWIVGDEAITVQGRSGGRLHVPPLTPDDQRAIWLEALADTSADVVAEIDEVVAEFSLEDTRIREVARRARHALADDGNHPRVVWDAAREEVRGRLGELARRIEPRATFEDLVLAPNQIQTLRDIVVHARRRRTVFETWGFAGKSNRGLGLSVLFAGQSGTGKTMAAEVLANELRLDLFHVDLSQVVSKFIGETEKNLRRLFDAADAGGAMLLFDEADSLFGKRSEVKDSHDRYANLEVSYLLQRMESFRGLAVLTTNMKSALDTAFLRRLRFIVQFPFPEQPQRAEIWRRTFPKDAPLDRSVDVERLSRLNVAGGTIRSIALNAAFLAAESGQAIGMSHLTRAARTEFAKMEKSLPMGELGGVP